MGEFSVLYFYGMTESKDRNSKCVGLQIYCIQEGGAR